ncbi:MAG: hypothetical protein GY866_22580 [Proteobacteria bacterium]|nr:hypothetical protein [Pseudomonadota bacterium]
MEWDAKAVEFSAYFKVENRSEKDAELAAIIEFNYTGNKRWRGVVLPAIKAKSEQFYKTRFPPGIMLKNDYNSITVKIYGKDYKDFFDNSSRYLQIRSRRLLGGGSTRIELEETRILADGKKSEPEKKIFLLGSEKDYSYLLTKGSFENIVLETISAEGETVVLTKSAKKQPRASKGVPPSRKAVKDAKDVEVEKDELSAILETVDLDDFATVETDPELMVKVDNSDERRQDGLKMAEEFKILDITSREKLIAIYLAEGRAETLTQGLTEQLTAEPDNLDISLTLSSVYVKQGKIQDALKVLNTSLNRISLSARVALGDTLKTTVDKGESTLGKKTEQAYLADEFFRIGILLLETKRFPESIIAFQTVGSLIPNYPLLKYHQGKSRHGAKHFNQAISLFQDESGQDDAQKRLEDILTDLTATLAVRLDVESTLRTVEICRKLLERKKTQGEKYIVQKRLAALKKILKEAKKEEAADGFDLEILFTTDSMYEDIEPGYEIEFDFKIVNRGKKRSSDFKVHYKLKHEKGMTFDITGVDAFPPLDPNEASRSWKKKILIPDRALPGVYRLVVDVEQTEGAVETTLKNNRLISGPDIALRVPETKPPAKAPEETKAVAVVDASADTADKSLDPLLDESRETIQIDKTRTGSNIIAQTSAVATTLLAMYLATEEANKHAELVKQNEEINAQVNSLIFIEERRRAEETYNSNIESMQQHKKNIEVLNGITALAIAWECYLFFFPSYYDAPYKGETGRQDPSLGLRWKIGHDTGTPTLNISLIRHW